MMNRFQIWDFQFQLAPLHPAPCSAADPLLLVPTAGTPPGCEAVELWQGLVTRLLATSHDYARHDM